MIILFPLIFLFLSVLLACLFIPDGKKIEAAVFQFIPCAFIALLVVFFYSFLRHLYPEGESFESIYLHFLFHNHLIFYILGIVIVVALMIKKISIGFCRVLINSYILFTLYNIIVMVAKFYYINHSFWFDPYMIFVFPGLLTFQAIFFSFLLAGIFSCGLVWKIVASLLIIPVPFVTAWVSANYCIYNYPAVCGGFAVMIILILICGFFIVFNKLKGEKSEKTD